MSGCVETKKEQLVFRRKLPTNFPLKDGGTYPQQRALYIKVESQWILHIVMQLNRRSLPMPRPMVVVAHPRNKSNRGQSLFRSREIGTGNQQIEVATYPQPRRSIQPLGKKRPLERHSSN